MEDLHGFGIQKVPDNPLCGLTPRAPDLRVAFVHCLILPGLPGFAHNFGTGPESPEKSHTEKAYVLRCANGHGLSTTNRLRSSLPRRPRRDPPRPNQISSKTRHADPCCWGTLSLLICRRVSLGMEFAWPKLIVFCKGMSSLIFAFNSLALVHKWPF